MGKRLVRLKTKYGKTGPPTEAAYWAYGPLPIILRASSSQRRSGLALTRGRHRLPRAYHQPWVAKSLFHMLMTASAAFSKSTCSAGAVSETIPVRV
jgi:hypothetical protein